VPPTCPIPSLQVPDVRFHDLFVVVPPLFAGPALSAAASPAGLFGPYDAWSVWRAGDPAFTQNVTVGTAAGATSSETGLLYGNTRVIGRLTQTLMDTQAHVMYVPSPAWAADTVNNPSSIAITTSTRVMPLSGQFGLALRVSTGSTGVQWHRPAFTTYYAVIVDLDASDPELLGDGFVPPLVRLVRFAGITPTVLAQRFWSGASVMPGFGNIGSVAIARGRWCTMSVSLAPGGVEVTMRDDATGNSSVILTVSETALGPVIPAGGSGLYLDGEAFFDDFRVTAPCATDGSCSGLQSNYHVGTGGVCVHGCPAGYLTEGTQMRTCNDSGAWAGVELVCRPQPPVWVQSVTAGDGGAILLAGQLTFNRTIDERSPVGTLLGVAVRALPPAAATGLDITYSIPANDPGACVRACVAGGWEWE
jgi:hypothetical protein